MAIKAFPFVSELLEDQPDRAIDEKDFRKLFSSYYTTGIFPNPSNSFQVTASGGMNITVQKGKANLNGVFAFEETETKTLTISTADTTNDRIDSIVLKLDDSTAVRNVDYIIKKGSPSSAPTRPTLTRNETVYEISLADIYVAKGTTQITQANITDTRMETERCGWVLPIQEIDTDTLYNQIKGDLSSFKSTEQENFTQWFNGIKCQLGTDIAGNLQNQINDIKETYIAKSNVLDSLSEIKKETEIGVSIGAQGFKEYISKNKFTTFETGDILQILELENGYIKIMGKTDSLTLNYDEFSKGFSKEIDLSNYNIDLSKRCFLQCSQEYGAGFDNVSLFLNGNKLRIISKVKTQSYFINWSIEGVVKE